MKGQESEIALLLQVVEEIVQAQDELSLLCGCDAKPDRYRGWMMAMLEPSPLPPPPVSSFPTQSEILSVPLVLP